MYHAEDGQIWDHYPRVCSQRVDVLPYPLPDDSVQDNGTPTFPQLLEKASSSRRTGTATRVLDFTGMGASRLQVQLP